MDPRRVTTLLVLAAVLAGTPVWAGLRVPIAGSGDLQFFADLSVFPTDDGARGDLAVAIYHPQLRFHADGNQLPTAAVQLHMKLARQGYVALDTTQAYALQAKDAADATDPRRYEVIELSAPVMAGHWALTVEVVDLQQKEQGLLSGATRGRGEGVLEVPDWAKRAPDDPRPMPAAGLSRGPRLGDPEFRIPAGDGTLLPRPERLYGIEQDTLLVYLEAAGLTPAAPALVGVEILDPITGVQGSDTIHFSGVSGRAAAIYRLPLDSFLEGSYVLRLTPAWNDSLHIDEEFSVAWRLQSVAAAGRDLALEAEIVLSDRALDKFRHASPPARLQMVQAAWDAVDPTPGTPENEVYEEFQRRAAYARRYFGSQFDAGDHTDRGRTYIRFGPPSEVSLEVIPFDGQALDQAIAEVHEVIQPERSGAQFKQAVPLDTPSLKAQRDTERSKSRLNGEGAFELWRYQLLGHPLVPFQDAVAENVHLRFLFVDRLGTGEYKLEFTNLAQNR